MLVLVGPRGSGKKELALKLVEEFPDYFGYGLVVGFYSAFCLNFKQIIDE